jgi:protein-L-isoaspartate(D-aspartate) O-methyltransferase
MKLRIIILILLTQFFVMSNCRKPQTSFQGEVKMRNDQSQQKEFEKQRQEMVKWQISNRDIFNKKVIEAMRKVPRHKFVPEEYREFSYEDRPLPIGYEQTISQPYIVAYMTQAIEPSSEDKVLEIGTGSGYQAAILAEIVKEVYTIEIIEPLARRAEETLKSLGYNNIHVRHGDGYRGWPEHAPFDGIVVTAAPDHIPQPLIDQLKVGGKMIIPVGEGFQDLILVEKKKDGISKKNLLPVRFVPMTGEAQKR